MKRDDAYKLLTKYLTNKNLLKHSLATEAAMRALYKRVIPKEQYNKTNEEKWGIVGLLHDADYEMARNHPEKHGLLLIEKEPTIPMDIAYPIKAHNYQLTKINPKSFLDWSIVTCDQLTMLIFATALMQPDKKIQSLTPELILTKLQDKTFAKDADKTTILLCEKNLGLKLEELIKIVLESMKGIAKELEL